MKNAGFIVSLAIATTSHGTAQESPAPVAAWEGEAEIREAIAAFVAAFAQGDAEAIASTFIPDGEVADADGAVIRGREAIAAHFAQGFRTLPGATLKVEPTSIRPLGPDLAIEEGRSTILPAGEGPGEVSRYEAIHARRDGKWLQVRVREFPDPELTPHDHLESLAWLVGDWVDEGDGGRVTSTCAWSDDENFLLRTFHLRPLGQDAVTVSQRIGWDPVGETIKAWVFDSRGLHGEESWARDPSGTWVIKATGVLPDGRRASATNRLTRAGPHSAIWESVDRTMGGEALPDSERSILVRRPEAPK